jgi:hypothetical protein
MLAIQTGEAGVVRLLIDAGADVNAVETFRNQTPLMWAAATSENAGEIVRMLLAAGADVTPRAMSIDWPSQITAEPRAQYRPVGGLTALLYAARDGCGDCVDVDGVAGPEFDELFRPTGERVLFSPKTIIRNATQSGSGQYDDAPMVFSMDGEHHAYVGRQGSDCVVIHDGKEVGRVPRERFLFDFSPLTISTRLRTGPAPAPDLPAGRRLLDRGARAPSRGLSSIFRRRNRSFDCGGH